jgi:hypothetical protein
MKILIDLLIALSCRLSSNSLEHAYKLTIYIIIL